MQKYKALFFLIACIIMACGNNPSKEEKPVDKAAADPPVYKMDMLEKMFNNDNWMKAEGNDTSFYYFSRIPAETKIYQYRISKGDSVNTKISVIGFSNDSLIWRYDDSTNLFLSGITEKRSEWTRMDKDLPGSFYMAFEQKDEKHITITFADNKQFLLGKTLPLSTFLIRSRYDYLHGTRFAFTDTVFSAGKKK
jgi:hypothetical protein